MKPSKDGRPPLFLPGRSVSISQSALRRRSARSVACRQTGPDRAGSVGRDLVTATWDAATTKASPGQVPSVARPISKAMAADAEVVDSVERMAWVPTPIAATANRKRRTEYGTYNHRRRADDAGRPNPRRKFQEFRVVRDRQSPSCEAVSVFRVASSLISSFRFGSSLTGRCGDCVRQPSMHHGFRREFGVIAMRDFFGWEIPSNVRANRR